METKQTTTGPISLTPKQLALGSLKSQIALLKEMHFKIGTAVNLQASDFSYLDTRNDNGVLQVELIGLDDKLQREVEKTIADFLNDKIEELESELDVVIKM